MNNPFINIPWLEETYKLIVDSYKKGRNHHSYLFVHKGSLGQEILAQELVKFFLCKNNKEEGRYFACNNCRSCIAYNLNTNPDYLPLGAINAKGEEAKISIDAVRDIVDRLYLPPSIAPQSVIFVPNASKLTNSSGNALLKILEEPREAVVFFLFMDSDQSLLPTIRSRCLLINLPTANEQQMLHYLNTHQIAEPDRSIYLSLAPYEPEKILKMHKVHFVTAYVDFLAGVLEALSTQEIEPIVRNFNCKDLSIFKWQLEGLVKILEDSLVHRDSLQIPYIAEIKSFFKINKEDLVEDHIQLINYYNYFLNQLLTFPDQLASESNLNFSAHKLAALLILHSSKCSK